MDNIFCIVGTVSFILACILAIAKETASEKEKQEVMPYMNSFKIIAILSGVSLLCFVLFGVVLFIEGHLF